MYIGYRWSNGQISKSSILKLCDLGTPGLAYLDRTRDSEERETKPRERERTDRNVRSDVYRTRTKQCRNWIGCVSVRRNCWHVQRECLFSYKRRNFTDPRSPISAPRFLIIVRQFLIFSSPWMCCSWRFAATWRCSIARDLLSMRFLRLYQEWRCPTVVKIHSILRKAQTRTIRFEK